MRSMTPKRLSALTEQYPVVDSAGTGDPEITAIAYDSRAVQPGSLFVAVAGYHVDGHDYIDTAVSAGARAVVCERMPDELTNGIPYICVASTRQALSRFAARFYDHPSQMLPVIGVTGTDGKSTVVSFIDQILTMLDEESGFISTPMIKRDLKIEKNPFRQSTPEAPELHAFLQEMRDNGKTFAIVEATSHGLSERTSRLRDINFHVAVFTNISHEHLDFHGSFEQYRSDKANLFRSLDRTAAKRRDAEYPIFGVVNLDDPNAYYFRHATRRLVLTYSIENRDADLYATSLEPTAAQTRCVVHWRRESREVTVPVPGPFNVENVLAAVTTVAHLLDRNPLDVLEVVPMLRGVPGRMEIVDRSLPYVPIVDYAHTPAAFEKILPMIKGYTAGRLVVVFGSAGERDIEKRAMLGEIAARHVDKIILADEDPRGEDPRVILDDIALGCERVAPSMQAEGRLHIIPDRREAIRYALQSAHEGDTLLFLGKGHERSIIYDDYVMPWYEADVVSEEIDRINRKGART
jgi:UDP-N-acetylmuramoyl-L-alanyl-D-glutamate--2,6-diaminopimelate ligase